MRLIIIIQNQMETKFVKAFALLLCLVLLVAACNSRSPQNGNGRVKDVSADKTILNSLSKLDFTSLEGLSAHVRSIRSNNLRIIVSSFPMKGYILLRLNNDCKLIDEPYLYGTVLPKLNEQNKELITHVLCSIGLQSVRVDQFCNVYLSIRNQDGYDYVLVNDASKLDKRFQYKRFIENWFHIEG